MVFVCGANGVSWVAWCCVVLRCLLFGCGVLCRLRPSCVFGVDIGHILVMLVIKVIPPRQLDAFDFVDFSNVELLAFCVKFL